MAQVIPLGVHTPSALPYLIGEALLPPDPPETAYTWQCFSKSAEELLWTHSCLVYSRDGQVQRVFRYQDREDEVRFALITAFASPRHCGDRALAIFAGKKCHIHFLNGASYVVGVPFEVECVFPATEGLLIQRRFRQRSNSTDKLPRAPPNSFQATQLQHSPYPKSPLGPGRSTLSFNLLDSPSSRRYSITPNLGGQMPESDDDDLPHLFSLSDPLADFCAVASATIAPLPRHLRSDDTDFLVEYDDIDASEKLIYVSPHNELATGSSAETAGPLLLMVTRNDDLGQITIWQGWYFRSKTLATTMAARNEAKLSRARRRSSFAASVSIVGAQTPTVRFHDRGRESFAASVRLPNEKSLKRGKKSKSDGSEKPNDEESMRSRMDPDFQGIPKSKGVRQHGSIISRADLGIIDQSRSHMGQSANFASSGRRGPSLRKSQDRRSFGTSIYRKSRGSMAASTFSKSVGPDDEDSMDLESDSWTKDDSGIEVGRTAQLYAATSEFSSLDSAFTHSSDGIKPEFIVRKVHVLPLPISPRASSRNTPTFSTKIRTLLRTASASGSAPTLILWVQGIPTEHCIQVNFEILRASPLPNQVDQPRIIPARAPISVPLYRGLQHVEGSLDIAKIEHLDAVAVVSLSAGKIHVAPSSGTDWTLPTPVKSRLFDSSDIRSDLSQSQRDVGVKRVVDVANKLCRLEEASVATQLCMITTEGLRTTAYINLRPENDLVCQALNVVGAVLPRRARESLMSIWASSCMFLRQNDPLEIDDSLIECQAVLMSFLSFAVGSLGRSSSKSPRKQRSSRARSNSELLSRETTAVPSTSSHRSRAWELLDLDIPESKTSSRSQRRSSTSKRYEQAQRLAHTSFTDIEANTRSLLHGKVADGLEWMMSSNAAVDRLFYSLQILLAVQNFREEIKLKDALSPSHSTILQLLAACLAQLGHYLHMDAWDWSSSTQLMADFGYLDWDFSSSTVADVAAIAGFSSVAPLSINQWQEAVGSGEFVQPILTLETIASLHPAQDDPDIGPKTKSALLPRLSLLGELANISSDDNPGPAQLVEFMASMGLTQNVLETLPDASAAKLRETIARCQGKPPTTWADSLLSLINREDLSTVYASDLKSLPSAQKQSNGAMLDLQTTISQAERMIPVTKSHEADRHAVIVQIFSEDRRFVDAARLMNPSVLQVAECPPRPEWSDIDHLDQQKRVMQWVMTRTIALSAGNAMVHYESQKPLISEKFHVPGFSMLCQMKPMDNTVSADRSGFTEEKFSWAFFHAGTSAGLHISRKAAGIDTSWIVFNKPQDLTNRHAGFLLALGLNGHLTMMAKWLAFKYLTPKHTMTSIGLLLGLSASHMGTMDSLITRMLSVHITRMLPPGAAELNVSPLTQTAGLLGIGLLYYNTQHRRMSEMMLSELEYRENEDAGSLPDTLRDESYRLAAGFSLGLMNLGKCADLRGLHGLNLLERLLSIAVGPRPVELVHVIDKATAASIIAIAFIYMKSNDASIARKIDIPDTLSQLDYIRPDALLLRALAKNLIMWDLVLDEPGWIQAQLPSYCSSGLLEPNITKHLRSSDIPTYNIIAGHAWSLSLRFAGSGSCVARDEILSFLDVFWNVSQRPALYYDAQLARTTVRRCIDILALSAATVMAGTGDLVTLRFLRRLHGRTDDQTTYGSHMAAHLAIGTLFLGGGTYTFATSDLAVASLIIAFYPLFPGDVLDNSVHLQAFRHLWVLAAEARCAVVMDIDSQRPIATQLRVKMKSGQEKTMRAPCLLPELDTISSLETLDPTYWHAKLDFENNEQHLRTFRVNQTLVVRKAPVSAAGSLVFSQTLNNLNGAQNKPSWFRMWAWLLKLPVFGSANATDLSLAIPTTSQSLVHSDERSTVLDDRLALWSDAMSWDTERLSNVRLLLKWAEKRRLEPNAQLRWLGNDFVEKLEVAVEQRMMELYGEEFSM